MSIEGTKGAQPEMAACLRAEKPTTSNNSTSSSADSVKSARRLLLGLSMFALLLLAIVVSSQSTASASNNYVVYWDGLPPDWTNWSNIDVALYDTSNPHSGAASIGTTFKQPREFVLLHHNAIINGNNFNTLSFWIKADNINGKTINVMLADQLGHWKQAVPINPPNNTWTKYDIPLAQLGQLAQINGIVWVNHDLWGSAKVLIDDVRFIASDSIPQPTPGPWPTPEPWPTPAPTDIPGSPAGTFTVNVNAVRHPISPYIYGINFAEEGLARELKLPVNRWGGNATSRYNYLINTSNRAHDWFFENIPGNQPASLPYGSDSDNFVAANKRTGTDSIITVPMIGWVAKSPQRACGFSVAKYGQQDGVDPWFTDCGTGTRNGTYITNNDPRDTSTPVNEAHTQNWIRHLQGQYGNAGSGGVRFYNLDNEPMAWHLTHRDVVKNGVGYTDIRDLTYRYAAAIKNVDPSAQTLGPALWGWTAYFYSGLDYVEGNWDNPTDRNTVGGGMPLAPWYLRQMANYERQNGRRILDYFDLHYYPQNPGVALTTAGDQATQQLRMRTTRGLWDRSYKDEYWIDEPTYIIPRMWDWVNANYPGTKLAMTEYNWGGLEHINGAVAQADVLGIFGAQNLHLATLWGPEGSHQPWAYAFRMYRNYDGRGGQFGNQSLASASPDPGTYAVYAARRTSDNAVTVMVVNKSWNNINYTLRMDGMSWGNAEIYRYSGANLNAIQQLGNAGLNNGQLSYGFPGQSITLFVIK